MQLELMGKWDKEQNSIYKYAYTNSDIYDGECILVKKHG